MHSPVTSSSSAFHPWSGYRPLTRAFQLSLSCATLLSSPHPIPSCLLSLSTDLCHVSLGLFLSLSPWGLHCMASLGMQGFGFLRVWPIQRHLLFLISSATGRWLVLSQMMSFLILSCHLTFRIFLRQLLMKVWTLRMTVSVVLQVSHPYSSTDLTFELNSLSLVLRENFQPCHRVCLN